MYKISEGGWKGWARFNKKQGKELERRSNKLRKAERNKAIQVKRFGDIEVDPDAVRAQENVVTAYPTDSTHIQPKKNKAVDAYVKKQNKMNQEELNYCRDVIFEGEFMNAYATMKAIGKYKKDRAKVGKGILPGSRIKPTPAPKKPNPSADAKKAAAKQAQAKPKPKSPIIIPSASDTQKYGKKSQYTKEGTYGGTFAQKAIDKYDSKKKKPAKKPMVDKETLKKAYGIRDEAYGDIKDRLKSQSNRDKDAKMVKKMQKVAFAHRTEGMGAAYMPQAEKGKTAERELTSKAVQKQLNRNRNKGTMKGDTEVPHIRYVQSRNRKTDLTKGDVGQKGRKRKSKKTRKEHFGDNPEFKNLLLELGDKEKMTQLMRMGLAKKGELHTMLRAMKRGPDAMKDPKLRGKLYDLLQNLTDIVTKDGQIFVKVRQNVQKNRKDLQDVEEALRLEGVIIGVNAAFEKLNITEDMSGMTVKSGHKKPVSQGAGMTKKGVAAYRRRNPGSKLQTAVTAKPSTLKPGSKAAGRRKAFCSRSKSWSSERGKAARRRWNC